MSGASEDSAALSLREVVVHAKVVVVGLLEPLLLEALVDSDIVGLGPDGRVGGKAKHLDGVLLQEVDSADVPARGVEEERGGGGVKRGKAGGGGTGMRGGGGK